MLKTVNGQKLSAADRLAVCLFRILAKCYRLLIILSLLPVFLFYLTVCILRDGIKWVEAFILDPLFNLSSNYWVAIEKPVNELEDRFVAHLKNKYRKEGDE